LKVVFHLCVGKPPPESYQVAPRLEESRFPFPYSEIV